MSLNPDAAKPKAYRLRLLQVLLAADLCQFGYRGNVIDIRHELVNNWSETLELDIFELIKRRLHQ